MIECASGGLPGWIQNFVISLIQRSQLTVVTVPRSEAVESGAIMPSSTLLTIIDNAQEDEPFSYKPETKHSFQVSRNSKDYFPRSCRLMNILPQNVNMV